ncbi:MAG: sensor domain-containing diguanylate cyclase [Gammaproteobacteria bacterium]|nr:sensor domain-containing diguanylate cyclase [Gammaproteobacteria bacterium]
MVRDIFHWRWLPLLTAAIVLLLPVSAWFQLKSNEDGKILEFVDMHATVVRDSITHNFGEHLLELTQVESCPEKDDVGSVGSWITTAELIVGHHPEVKMVACNSSDNRPNIVSTVLNNDEKNDRFDSLLQRQQQHIEQERVYSSRGISAWFTEEKPTLLVITIPLSPKEGGFSYLVSFIDVKRFLHGIHSIALPESFGLSVSSRGIELYNSEATPAGQGHPWTVTQSWDGPADLWSIHVWPVGHVVEKFRSNAIYLPLFVGPLLASLLGFVIFIAQKNRLNFELLNASNRRLNAILDSSNEAIFTVDPHGQILSCNDAAQQSFCCSEDDLIGLSSVLLFPAREDYQSFNDRMIPALKREGFYEDEIVLKQIKGELFPAGIKISQLKLGEEYLGMLVIIRDLTKHKRADYDVLTELPNRSLFYERLLQALSQASRYSNTVAVLFLDLDGFKPINDTLGHKMGDELLRQVADRISRCVRKEDTVSRIGGDEFTILLNTISQPDDAALIAGNILQSLQKVFRIANRELEITASIGISIFPQDGVESEDLVNKADEAMYAAKRAGKNNFQFFK